MAIYDKSSKKFLCECGCGEECLPWNSYSKAGHNVRVRNPTESMEVRNSISATVTKLWDDPDYIRNQGLSGKIRVPIEVKLEFSEPLCACGCNEVKPNPLSRYKEGHWARSTEAKEVFSDPERGLRISRSLNLHYLEHPETREVLRLAGSKTPRTTEWNERISQGLLSAYRSNPEIGKGISESLSGRTLSPEHVEAVAEGLRDYYSQHPEAREHLSDVMKEHFKDPKYVKDHMTYKRPNKAETSLLDYLEEDFPGVFKYTGGGSKWIGGRNPDYVSEEFKLVVELNGEYWHQLESDEEFESHYTKYGYKCLVIWYSSESLLALDYLDLRDSIKGYLRSQGADINIFGQ